MERGRILIMGHTKDTTYEIRNLLDNRRFELEIALSKDIGKAILCQRRMDLLILHTEMIDEDMSDFFEYLEERGVEVPVFILGEEASRFRETVPARTSVNCFTKPYAVEEMLTSIKSIA